MGCTQSKAAVVVTVTESPQTVSSSGGTNAKSKHQPTTTSTPNITTTVIHHPQHCGNDPVLAGKDRPIAQWDQSSTPSSRHHQSDDENPLMRTTTTTTDSNNNNYDDFTRDYIILKQVMVGMSALSNIYMVMKRPKTSNVVLAAAEAENVSNNCNVMRPTSPSPPEEHQQKNDDDDDDDENDTIDDQRRPHREQTTLAPTPRTPTTEASTNDQEDPTVTTTTTNQQHVTKNDDNNNNEIFVLQVIDMESVAPERRKSMRKEIIALQSIVHPNILRVHAVYDATRRDNTIATVTELCTGSHLHSSIPYPEPRVKIIITQILDALQYMHQRKIFHNSLNTENILFQDDSQDAIIKITYAGVANVPSQSNSNSSKNTNKYSNRFVIPEWNPSGKDIYSVGMIAYKLLSGGKEPPTDMDTQRVVPGTNLFLGRRWKLISISKNAKHFIEQCLHSWDKHNKFTVEDAIHHIWLTQEHIHRSDTTTTSRSNEMTIPETAVVVAKWNVSNVGSSLTASEPASVFQSTNESVPMVSLTTEQYKKEVASRAMVSDELVSNVDVNSSLVVVSEAIVSDVVIGTDSIDKAPEEIVPGNIEDNTDKGRVQIDTATNIPLDCTNVSNDTATVNVAADDIAASDPDEDQIDGTNISDIDIATDDILAVPDTIANGDNCNVITESIITNSNNIDDDSTPHDISETDTPEEFAELRNVFQEVTTTTTTGLDNTTTPITMETFKEKLRTKYTEEEVNSWFTGQYETYEDPKTLNYKVFLRKVIQNRKSIEIQRVDKAFKLIDKGKHGYVTVGNLRAVLGKDNNDNIEQLIKAADTRRDGTISYNNFERVVQNYLSTTTTTTDT